MSKNNDITQITFELVSEFEILFKGLLESNDFCE